MKIKWIGKYDGKNLPTVDVEVGAKELPEVTSKSAILLIPIVLLFALINLRYLINHYCFFADFF